MRSTRRRRTGWPRSWSARACCGSVEFSRAVRRAPDRRAGGCIDLLVSAATCGADVLLQALRLQTSACSLQLLRWEQGEFKFYAATRSPTRRGSSRSRSRSSSSQCRAGAPAAPARRSPARPVPPSGPRRLPAPAAPAMPADAGRPPLRVVRRRGLRRRRDTAAIWTDDLGRPDPQDEGGARRGRAKRAGRCSMKVLAGTARRCCSSRSLALAPLGGRAALPLAGRRAGGPGARAAGLALHEDRPRRQDLLLAGGAVPRAACRNSRKPDSFQRATCGIRRGGNCSTQKSEESYTLQPMEDGKPVEGTEMTEAITGNFLLDPEFLATPAESSAAPGSPGLIPSRVDPSPLPRPLSHGRGEKSILSRCLSPPRK